MERSVDEAASKPTSAFDDIFDSILEDYRLHKGKAEIIKEVSYDVNLEALHNVSKLRLYQPLLDGHLSDYFNNASTRRHLQKLGLVRYLIQIDSNGRIVDDAAFKRHQISLDKKAESENAQHLDMQRKMHLEIQNLLRHSSARVNNEKRLKPTSTDPAITALTKLFPERLKNTAAIYIKEMENNSRSNDASSASGEKKTLTRPASAKGREITYGQKNALHNQNSILDIFVKAKEDYEDGKLGSSERNLRYILKLVQHSAKKSPGSKRPKSARPTRDSKYPISEFSDGDSEPGNQEELAKSTSSLNGVLDQPEKSRSQKSLTFSDRVLEISADATISPIAIAEIKKSTLSLAKQDIVAERQGKEDFENLRLVGDVDESGNALHISESTPQPLLKRPETAVGSFPDMSPMFLDEEGSGEAKCRDIVVLNDSALLGQEGNLHNPSAVVPDIKDFIIGFDTEFYGEIPAESVPIINRDAGKLVVVEVPSENLRKESSNGLDHVQVKLRDTNETEDNQFEDAESVAFILSSLGDIYSEKFNNDAAVLQTSDSAANMHNSREKIEQEADKSGDANVQDNLTAAQLQDSITDVKNLQRKDPVAVPLTPQSRKFNPFSGISSMFSKRAKQPMLEANSTESPLPIERKNTKRNLDQTSIPNLIAEKKKAHVGEKELKCELSQPGSSAADTTSQPSEIITAKTEPDIVPAVANQAEYPQLTVVSVGNSQHDSIPLETDIKENEPITIHPVVHLAEEYYEGQEVTSASLAVSPMHEKQEIKNMNNANPQGAKSVIERKLHHRGKEGGVKKPQPAGVHHKSKLPRGVDATPTTQSNRSIQKSDSQDIGKPPAKALGTFSQPTPTRLEPDSLSGSGLSMALKSYFSNSSRKEKALMRQQGLKQARNALGINLHGEVIVASRLADSHNASQSDNIIASTADDVSEKAAEKVVGLSSSEKSNSVRPASKSNLTEKSASARSVKDKSSSAMSSVENVATGNAVDAKTDASASENMIGGKQKSTNDELMKSASAKSVKEKAGSTRSIVGFEYIEKTAGPQGGKSASENILGARPKSAKIKLGKSASARSANEMSGSTGSITGNGAIAKPPTKSKLEKAASAISITGKAASTGKILGKAISSKKIPNNGNDYIQNKDAKLGSSNSASSKKLASEAKVAADQASSMKSVKYGSDTLSRKPTGSLKEVGNLNQSENSVARNAVLSQNELLNGKSAAPSGAIYWSQKISSRNQSKILNSGTKSSSSSLRGFYSEKSLISENLGSKPAILQTEQTIPNPEALSVPCKADSESNSQEIYHTSAHLSNPDIDNYVVYPVEHLEEQVVIVKENENVMAESGLTEAAVHPDLHQSKISPEIEGGETQHSVVIIDQAGRRSFSDALSADVENTQSLEASIVAIFNSSTGEIVSSSEDLDVDSSKLESLKSRRSFRGELSQKKMQGVREDESGSEIAQIQSQAQDFQSVIPAEKWEILLMSETTTDAGELEIDNSKLDTLKARRSFRGELSQKKMKGVSEDELESEEYPPTITDHLLVPEAEIIPDELAVDDTILQTLKARRSFRGELSQKKMKGVDEDEGEHSVQLQENEVTTAAIAEIMVNNLSIDDNHGTDDIAGPNGTENDVDPAKLEFLYSTRGRLSAKKLSGYQEEDEEVPVVKNSTLDNSLLDLDDEPDEGTIQIKMKGVDEDEGEYSVQLQENEVTTAAIAEIMVNNLSIDDNHGTDDIAGPNATENDVDPAKLELLYSTRGRLSAKKLSGYQEEDEEVPVVKKSTIENSLLDLDDEPDEGTIQKMTESSELEPSAVTNLLGDDEEDATSQLKIENLKSRRSFRGELSTKRMSGLSEEAEAGSPKPSLIQNLRNSITSLMRKGSKDLGSHFSLEKESAVPAEGSLPKANILDSEESDNIPTVQHKKARSFTDDASRVM